MVHTLALMITRSAATLKRGANTTYTLSAQATRCHLGDMYSVEFRVIDTDGWSEEILREDPDKYFGWQRAAQYLLPPGPHVLQVVHTKKDATVIQLHTPSWTGLYNQTKRFTRITAAGQGKYTMFNRDMERGYLGEGQAPSYIPHSSPSCLEGL